MIWKSSVHWRLVLKTADPLKKNKEMKRRLIYCSLGSKNNGKWKMVRKRRSKIFTVIVVL